MKARNGNTPAMTKEELLAYLAGYEAVNRLEIEQLRSMSLDEKFEHAAALMESARVMGWTEALASEDDDVRAIWIRLKRAYTSGG